MFVEANELSISICMFFFVLLPYKTNTLYILVLSFKRHQLKVIISKTSDEIVTFLKLFIAGTTRQNKASTVPPYYQENFSCFFRKIC